METNNSQQKTESGYSLGPIAKILIGIIIVAIGYVGFKAYKKSQDLKEGGVKTENVEKKEGKGFLGGLFKGKEDSVVVVRGGLNPWGGFGHIVLANNGFKPNKESAFYKEYGFMVELSSNDEFTITKNRFINGELEFMYCTVDALMLSLEKDGDLAKLNIGVFMKVDRSNGGDIAVAVREVRTLNDLKRKRIAYTPGTPNETLLIAMLDAAGLTKDDVTLVTTTSPLESSSKFQSGLCDVALVWTPDDALCYENVKGSHKLFSTEEAPYTIYDAFVAKRAWLDANPEIADALAKEFMLAAEAMTADPAVKERAIDLLAESFGIDREVMVAGVEKSIRSTYGDNLDFFGLNVNYNGVTGEELYNRMSTRHIQLRNIENPVEWRKIAYPDVIKRLDMKAEDGQAGEQSKVFKKADEKLMTKQALSSKAVSIYFATGSAELTEEAMSTIDEAMGDESRNFANLYIRIVGNTDNEGSAEVNRTLSKKRADAVKNYMVRSWNVEPNRCITRGDGPKKALEAGALGRDARFRVTDFEFVVE